jgi:hypothetical protein
MANNGGYTKKDYARTRDRQKLYEKLCKIIDMNLWSDVYSRLFVKNDFSKELTVKAKQDITEFLSFLISINKDNQKTFLQYLLSTASYPEYVASVLFANMNKIEINRATEQYNWIIAEQKHTKKPLQMIESIINIYDIKIVNRKTLFGKTKILFEFPTSFYGRIIEEVKSLPPKEVKKEIISGDDWDNFVDWWGICDEDELKDDLHLGAYMMMWYHNEVLNGGYTQFFDNKSDWDFDKVATLFEKFLPQKEFLNFSKAIERFKNGGDCEEFNKDYEEESVELVLQKMAKRIVKTL